MEENGVWKFLLSFVVSLFCVSGWGGESGVLHIADKCFTTGLYIQMAFYFFVLRQNLTLNSLVQEDLDLRILVPGN